MGEINIRLKQARQAAGLTQQQLADRVGVGARQHIGRWETSVEPKAEHLLKLSKALGVPLEWIVFGDEKT